MQIDADLIILGGGCAGLSLGMRLAELGPVEIEIVSTGAEAVAVAESLNHKSLQLAEMGVHSFTEQDLRNFFSLLMDKKNGKHSSLHLFRLLQSGKTISSLIGAAYGKTFWLMILSMSPDAPRQFSPGDYILRRSIAWACENNLEFYDFSNGHSVYKEIWADEEVNLFDYFAAKTLRGLPLAAFFVFYFTAKRGIKNTALLKSFFFHIRKLLRGK